MQGHILLITILSIVLMSLTETKSLLTNRDGLEDSFKLLDNILEEMLIREAEREEREQLRRIMKRHNDWERLGPIWG
uniref:Envelope stress response membrane protein PspB n=1 Tax=Heterorhabditis bacteriophora TaxID=37862 RepID=A0A1I7XGL0_HETBA